MFLVTCLLLGGAALCRVMGVDAVPIIGVALIIVGQGIWRQRQARLWVIRRATVRLRPLTAAQRSAAIASVKSNKLRAQIEQAVERQGTETRDGAVERFPFPAVFRARAARKFWTAWAVSAAVLGIAAFARDLTPSWRAAWLALGCLLALRARRVSRLSLIVASDIEITPFRLSFLAPDPWYLTLSFADGIRLEDQPEHAMLIVRSGEIAIPVSYHLIGSKRLISLVRTYGNLPSEGSLQPSPGD